MPDSPLAGRTAAGRLPLSALLSQTLVAFTIEFDNEAERQIPHVTTNHGGTRGGVWLVSMAMWLNCMRYVGQDPVLVGDVRRLARGRTNLDGMRRWGYVKVMPDPADRRRKPPDDDLLMYATGRGLRAKLIWEPLTAVVEQRWRDRYGQDTIGQLTDSLQVLASQLGGGLPDCLPILGYGLFSADTRASENRHAARPPEPASEPEPPSTATVLPLPWLLARVLLSLAAEFELESRISLAIAANVLRLTGEDGTRIKDLPERSGVSAEGLKMATGYLEHCELAVTGPEADGGKWKAIRLTPAGAAVAGESDALLAALEDRWARRYGTAAIAALRQPLETLADGPQGAGRAGSPLFAAIEPSPDGWRASVRRPATLPHYPMVLHRGGYPDGS
jgi:hypothetical protein